MSRGEFDGVDELRHLVHGTEVELVQMEPGRLRGQWTQLSAEGFALSVGQFSHGVRGRGVLSGDRVTLGAGLASGGPSSQWAYACHPDDLIICPAGSDHESTYRGSNTICAVSVQPQVLAAQFSGERQLEDPRYWESARSIHASPAAASHLRQVVLRMLSAHRRTAQAPEVAGLADADAVRQALVEAFGAGLLSMQEGDDAKPAMSAARIVRRVEDHMAEAGARAVHVAELCAVTGLTRRSLHRAFFETLGMGPIAFLNKSRLSSVHSILRRADPKETRVSDVAARHGFVEMGRFAAHYKALFGERPVDTLRKAPGQGGRAAHRRAGITPP